MDQLELAAAFDEFAQAAAKLATALRAEVKRTVLVETPSRIVDGSSSRPAPRRVRFGASPSRRESKPTPLPTDDAPAGGDKMRRTILIALAQFGRAMTNAQIGLYSGKAHKGGAFAKGMAGLREDECMEGPGDANRITSKGFDELGDWARLPEGNALLFEFWCSKLGSMESQILRAVRKSHAPMSTAAIGETIDKSHTGGAFAKAMARLRKMDLVEGGGDAVELSPILRRAIEPTVRVFDKNSGASVKVHARTGHAHV